MKTHWSLENPTTQFPEPEATKAATEKKRTTTSMTSDSVTKRVSRKKSSSSIHSISSPVPVEKTFDGIVDFDFGNLVIVSPVVPKVEAPDQSSVVIVSLKYWRFTRMIRSSFSEPIHPHSQSRKTVAWNVGTVESVWRKVSWSFARVQMSGVMLLRHPLGNVSKT